MPGKCLEPANGAAWCFSYELHDAGGVSPKIQVGMLSLRGVDEGLAQPRFNTMHSRGHRGRGL